MAPKWVENGRQDLRIYPHECPGHFQASGALPAAPNPQKYSPKLHTQRQVILVDVGWKFRDLPPSASVDVQIQRTLRRLPKDNVKNNLWSEFSLPVLVRGENIFR